MKILVIIPAFNEAKNIEAVVTSLEHNCPEVDYIIIDDCSTDSTLKICIEKKFNYISLPINLGIGGVIQTGYMYALKNDYDIAVQIDGDGQHDPRYLHALLTPIIENQADIVIGSRFIDKTGFQSSVARRTGINLLSKIIQLCYGIHIADVTSGFRAVNRKMIEIYSRNYAQDYPEPEAIAFGALCKARIKEIPVSMNDRIGGVSSISAAKAVYYMIKVSIAIIINRLLFEGKSASL